jgi:hypothetical protein
MAGLREFFESGAGKIAAMVFGLVALIIAVVMIVRTFGHSEAASLSTDRVYIDTETGKTFNYTIKPGDLSTIKSPYTGKLTGVEAERCYWTKDGKPKKDPTYVLLNERAGKPGPTFCPDCGRLVVPLNPPASTIGPPPPTKAEYEKTHKPGARGMPAGQS